MRLKRILTGVIGFPIIALLLIYGNKYILDALFSLAALISTYELFNTLKISKWSIRCLGYIAAILICFIHLLPIKALTIIALMFIPTSIVFLFLNIIITSMEVKTKDIFSAFFGICYIVGFIVFLPLIYAQTNGKILIWYLLFAAWGTDTFAYAIGIRFGKHKFSKISPKKSIEGCIGGTIGSVIIAVIFTYVIKKYVNIDFSYIYIIMVALVLSILSQIGDLSASTIKREMDVKDYGNLLPGHGGMLDRIDSLIFIAPFAYLLLILL